jgi:hypothetical protein
MFLGLLDPDPLVRGTDPALFSDFYLEINVNVPSKRKQQSVLKNLLFVGVLKVNDENSRIWIRTKISWILNTVSQKSFIKLWLTSRPLGWW